MGAFTLARLIAREASRRPRAVLATIMLALSAGFIILPDPGANYATMTLHGAPLVYTPAVMGIITGEMFIAFSIVLVVLAMSVIAPLRTWRAVLGVAAAPGWKLGLGLWLAAFGAGLFVLSSIFGGALLRASNVLSASGVIAHVLSGRATAQWPKLLQHPVADAFFVQKCLGTVAV